MRYYIIAGERSGDLHASNLMVSLQNLDAEATFRFVGGEYMQSKYATGLYMHYKSINYMGFWEVFKHAFTLLLKLNEVQNDIISYKPDVLILIDFSGFNMRIAKFAKSKNLQVHYYIAPKVWAWNTKRAYKIKKYVDFLYVILPFEVTFFKQLDYETTYVGNPVKDAIRAYAFDPDFRAKYGLQYAKIIAVLPGSRKAEVQHMLGVMLSVIPTFKDYTFVVAGVDNVDPSLYEPIKRYNTVRIIFNATYDILKHAEAALVTSGTATLETGILHVPQVVCYKTSLLTYYIIKKLIRVPFISLINLIAEKKVVTELIQHEFVHENVIHELNEILTNDTHKNKMLQAYTQIDQALGEQLASDRTAAAILKNISVVSP